MSISILDLLGGGAQPSPSFEIANQLEIARQEAKKFERKPYRPKKNSGREKVFDFLTAHPGKEYTTHEVGAAVDMLVKEASRCLSALYESGQLHRKGKRNRYTYYFRKV